jgi:hypothetical protein
VAELEVAIIGDGMTDETREVARSLARHDDRVRLHDFPKGESRGELHRHRVLSEARAPIVCYLSDDDLWLPNHLETMLGLLEGADFASAPALVVDPAGTTRLWFADLGAPFYRDKLLGNENRVPLSCAAHTLELYRQLPSGWRVTPADTPTDLYMWHQILAQGHVRAASGFLPTVVNFPAAPRRGWTTAERAAELLEWQAALRDDPGRVSRLGLRAAMRALTALEANLGLLRGELSKAHEATRRAMELAAQRESELGAQRHARLHGEKSALQTKTESAELARRLREEEELRRSAEELLARFAATRTWRAREAIFRLPGVEWAWRMLRSAPTDSR